MGSGPAWQTRNRTEVSGPLLFREQGVADSNPVIPNSFIRSGLTRVAFLLLFEPIAVREIFIMTIRAPQKYSL